MMTKADPLLGCACVAFNIQLLPSPKAKAQLAQVQDRILAQVKSPLWRCPPSTLHVTLTPLLSVRLDYAGGKEERWREDRGAWTQRLEQSTEGIRNWTIHYQQMRLTEAAVFVVAEDGGVANQIRRQLALPESQGWDLVHTTLFRFASDYEMPASDQEIIRAERVDIADQVTEILIAHEKIYPSIDSEVMTRIAIGN